MAAPKHHARAGGRKKGIPNKVTTAAKEAIALAAEKLGGTDRLVAWAKEDPANERVFWGTIYPKLLPLQVNGNMTIRTLAQEIKGLDAGAKDD